MQREASTGALSCSWLKQDPAVPLPLGTSLSYVLFGVGGVILSTEVYELCMS